MSVSVHLCGWGVIEAAVRATRLIKDLRPRRVWLVGIAGAISSVNPLVPNLTAETTTGAGLDLELGQAYEFTRITIDGIGVGQGSSHLSSISSAGKNYLVDQSALAESLSSTHSPKNTWIF